MGRPRRIAYLVSRFPANTQTFVVRELNAVTDGYPDLSVELHSLFPPFDSLLHASAGRWMDSLQRPSLPEALGSTLWWAARRPLRLAGSFLEVARRCRRSPGILVRSLATLPLAAAQARRMRRDGIDHVHAHFASYPALSAWLIGRLAGIPYSFTAHAYDLFVDQSTLATKVAGAKFVVTISEYNRRFLKQYGGDSQSPVQIVHYGIDASQYAFEHHRIPAEGRIRTLCVAALQEKKGHAVLFEAIARGGPELDRLSVDLIGDGELREELEAKVHELGLEDRVRFHGRQEESVVREMLAASDLFVLPSLQAADGQMEGLPNALIEALASGLTAVSTRLSGTPELIREGETGLLAEPGDPESLAAALRRAISGPPIDADRGRRLVESEFNVDASAQQMHELLSDRAAAG